MVKKKWKAKEYDDYGKLIFEGEYLNGEKWNGKAKEYFKKNDKLMFEREYLNCKKKEKPKKIMIMVI